MSSITAVLKIGCGKFIHGEGTVSLLGSEIARLGGKALIVGGPTSIDRVMAAAGPGLDEAGVSHIERRHTEHCTTAWAERYVRTAREEGCTVLVGVGGGKCIDEMKCASQFSDLPIITVPTCIATCAATSMVCIMYNEKGQRAPAVNLKKEVDVCIADTALIATAPRRTLAAGILDSMAKMPECFHQKHIASYRDCTLEEYVQVINSQAIFSFLTGEARGLYAHGGDAKRFPDAITTNLLHTSIVSGFADGSGQLALAHATYDFMRTYNTEASYHFLHGEMVAVGLLIQMAYNNAAKEEIQAVRDLMRDMDMPLTLKDLEYDRSPEDLEFFLQTIAKNANVTEPDDLAHLRGAMGEALS